MKLQSHIEQRLGFFKSQGYLDLLPTKWQLRIGTLAMLPVSLSESERERSRSRQTWFGQVPIRVPLQIAYCPAQLFADSGISMKARDIVKHLISVYHEDAFIGYDLQLLHSHPNGLELLQYEAQRIVDGKNRCSSILQRVVGYEGYHAGLIELAERAKLFTYPNTQDLDPRFVTLVGFSRFCTDLPKWPNLEFYGFDLQKLRKQH
jgi:hypothetical protein